MIWLPGLDITDNCIQMTEGQAVVTALVSYFTTGCFVLILGLAVWNTYHFLYKQRKWKVYPLLLFYILSYVDILLRIYHSFWMIALSEHQ